MKIAYHVCYDFGTGAPRMDEHEVVTFQPGKILWLRGWGSPLTGKSMAAYQPTKAAAIDAYVASCRREMDMRERQITSLRAQIAVASNMEIT